MIVFKNVTKEYKNHKITKALDDVTFEIKTGEFVFIVGPSGSGKSTIVRMLVREEVPTLGEIYFNDVDITKLKRKGLPILRREIGVVFQDYKLLPHKTVFENVAFLLEVSGKKNDEIKKTTNAILDLVGFTVYVVLHSETEEEALTKEETYPEELDIVFLDSMEVLKDDFFI